MIVHCQSVIFLIISLPAPWGNGSEAPLPPSILDQPDDLSVVEGSPAVFNVTAGGTGPLSYQWERDGVPIAGETGTSLTLPPVTLIDDGTGYRCVVTSNLGTVTSETALLTVTAAVGITLPDVVGLQETSAIDQLTSAGLIVGLVTSEPSEVILAGNVVSQSPLAGCYRAAGYFG